MRASMEKERDEMRAQYLDKIKQLEQEITRLKSNKRRARKSRSYNAREFKDYLRPSGKTRRPPYADDATSGKHTRVIHKTVDIRYCPKCGDPLSESATKYYRTSEDSLDCVWTKTEWTVMRRNCKTCSRPRSASLDGVITGEHFGAVVIAQVYVMRCLTISYEKIARI